MCGGKERKGVSPSCTKGVSPSCTKRRNSRNVTFAKSWKHSFFSWNLVKNGTQTLMSGKSEHVVTDCSAVPPTVKNCEFWLQSRNDVTTEKAARWQLVSAACVPVAFPSRELILAACLPWVNEVSLNTVWTYKILQSCRHILPVNIKAVTKEFVCTVTWWSTSFRWWVFCCKLAVG